MRTQRPEKHIYQIDYISVEICSQKTKLRKYHYRRLYDHVIEFRKGIMLFKPIKIYLLFLAERNSLNRWIDEELEKVLK